MRRPRTATVFSIILGVHDVAYFQCVACHSLQTQKPYWLESAYQHNLAELDTGQPSET